MPSNATSLTLDLDNAQLKNPTIQDTNGNDVVSIVSGGTLMVYDSGGAACYRIQINNVGIHIETPDGLTDICVFKATGDVEIRDIAVRNVEATAGCDITDAYSIGGTQVVGPQGAAVANATGAGDVVAQLNALLVQLRLHGLIGT